jgi:hypothetical protein
LISHIQLWKPFCAETRNFDVWAKQRSWIKFCVELSMTLVQTRDLSKPWVCKNCFKDFSLSFAKYSVTGVYESERKVMDRNRFSRKNQRQQRLSCLRKVRVTQLGKLCSSTETRKNQSAYLKVEKICKWKVDGYAWQMRPFKWIIVWIRIIVTITDKVYVTLQWR